MKLVIRNVREELEALGREGRYARWLDRTTEAISWWPPAWYVTGQVIVEATDTPRTPWARRIATVAVPDTIQWNPRFLGFATRGITAHESVHLFQLQPGSGRDALQALSISRSDQLRLSYNGTLLEGIPYIIQRAMGTRPGWDRLQAEEPAVAAALLEWFDAYTIRGPDWIQEELGMARAPDIPQDFPATTIWAPAHPSNYWPAPHYGLDRTNIKGLCFHTPQEPADDRESTPIYFANPVANASTDYYADDDGDLYQMVRDKDFSWAQGTRAVDAVLPRPTYFDRAVDISYNAIFLSIEVEGFAASIGRTMFPGSPQFETVAQWAALKVAEYEIPLNRSRLVGHLELNKRKSDPGSGFPWTALLIRIQQILDAGQPVAPPPDLGFVARLELLESQHAVHEHKHDWPDEAMHTGPPIYPG